MNECKPLFRGLSDDEVLAEVVAVMRRMFKVDSSAELPAMVDWRAGAYTRPLLSST